MALESVRQLGWLLMMATLIMVAAFVHELFAREKKVNYPSVVGNSLELPKEPPEPKPKVDKAQAKANAKRDKDAKAEQAAEASDGK